LEKRSSQTSPYSILNKKRILSNQSPLIFITPKLALSLDKKGAARYVRTDSDKRVVLARLRSANDEYRSETVYSGAHDDDEP
jgi:hypothetical protein